MNWLIRQGPCRAGLCAVTQAAMTGADAPVEPLPFFLIAVAQRPPSPTTMPMTKTAQARRMAVLPFSRDYFPTFGYGNGAVLQKLAELAMCETRIPDDTAHCERVPPGRAEEWSGFDARRS